MITLGISFSPFVWILPIIQQILVGLLISINPSGTIPFQFGPVIKNLISSVPVVRFPNDANTFVQASKIWNR